MTMHDDQVDVTTETVAALIRDQFRQWADEAVRPLDSSTGTMNTIFRIGDGLSARFPLHRAGPGETLVALEQEAREARAAAELARVSRFPAPEPVALVAPGAGCPMPWAVQTWLPGTNAFGGRLAPAGPGSARGVPPGAGLRRAGVGARPGVGVRAGDGPRAVATRYDKLAVRYEATVLVAAINEWL